MARAEGRASKESKEELDACGMITLLPEEEEEGEISVGIEPLGMPSWGWTDMIGVLESAPLVINSGVLAVILDGEIKGDPQADEPKIVEKVLGEQPVKV